MHYEKSTKTLSWTNLLTQAQGEGFLSYIQNKEKLTAAQIQDFGVTIVADCQLKQEAMEAEQQAQQRVPLPKYAQKILETSQPICNTIAETYMTEAFDVNALPNDVAFRFHEKVFLSEDKQYHPALLIVGCDGHDNPSQVTAVFLDNKLDNASDNNMTVDVVGEKVWGDENIHSGIWVNRGDGNLTFVTHTLESALVLQAIHNHSSIIAIDDVQGLTSQQLNQTVIMCIEQSLVNDASAQANLMSTVERLEACGKHVLLHYLPDDDIHGGKYQSLAELREEKGLEGLKEVMKEVRSIDSVMQEVSETEKVMRDELEELNKGADHHSIEDEKRIHTIQKIEHQRQDFEMEL